MQYRTLGKTGLKVSALGFGAAPAAFLKTERDQVAKLINDLLDAGVNLIDTAAAYPGSEKFIGEYLSARRKDYILVSKCGNVAPPGVRGSPWSEELVTATIDHALMTMKTNQIDVMLLHSCNLPTLQSGEAFEGLLRAKKAGKIKHAGYSGDNQAAAYACELPGCDVIEISINYVDQNNIDAVLPLAAKNNIGVIAKRPIANAAWLGLEGRDGIYINYVKEYVRRHNALGVTPIDAGFTDSDWAEFALRFTLSFPEVSTAIVGTTNPQNALANLKFVDKGALTSDQVQVIRAKFRATPGSAEWSGQT
ncbi:MAG TPA: aldo/keto reductase [Tepidisphaeraceae bacterium]|nr:aldo/keto reductase [Tepidisphaeraceae bacterium]